jgi:hypothetical protein
MNCPPLPHEGREPRRRATATAALAGCLAAALLASGCAAPVGGMSAGTATTTRPALPVVDVRFGPDGTAPAAVQAKVERLARTDQTACVAYCLAAAVGRWRDYTCTFAKQERIGGLLGKPQRVAVKFREEPFSVAMRWLENPPIADRILYVEGAFGGRMLVRPGNLLLRTLAPGGTFAQRPDAPEVMKNTLRPVTAFGFIRTLESMLAVYRRAKAAGELEEAFGGAAKVAGRRTVVMVRRLPEGKGYPGARTLTYLDPARLLLVRIESYGMDGHLRSRYTYEDVKFDVGLTDEDFRPEANDLTAPR